MIRLSPGGPLGVIEELVQRHRDMLENLGPGD
jgi:hypothetical protein